MMRGGHHPGRAPLRKTALIHAVMVSLCASVGSTSDERISLSRLPICDGDSDNA
jgi:hypothetical protein